MECRGRQGQRKLAGFVEVKIEEQIHLFMESTGREKKLVLKDLLKASLTRDQVILLAPAIRDSSPRISARVTALLARWKLEEVFEEHLKGLKPGKQSLLRGHFSKIGQKAADS